MISHSRTSQALAISLAALAGYVDAIAYLETGGFFVSFMSGNTTRLGVGLAHGSIAAVIAFGLIGCFVIGVTAASLAGDYVRKRRRTTVLFILSLMLATAAFLAAIGDKTAAIACLAIAMGAENVVLGEEGEASVALTYMTGTIVKLGRYLSTVIQGGDVKGWGSYLLLWAGLLGGGTLGAIAYSEAGMSVLWAGAGFAALLAVITKCRIETQY
ncbi:YoaK family protein [Sphingomonas sp.]|uniref:YoaK family protein n=1 Tax=Sphingomonas sp. TaxID=28214 RepID=UPI0025DE1C4E|nr:YoaK family protein [Sphingomonas sp.]